MRGRKRDSIIELGNKEVVISTCWTEKNLQKTIQEPLRTSDWEKSCKVISQHLTPTQEGCHCEYYVVKLLDLFLFLKCLFLTFFLIHICISIYVCIYC